MFTKRSLQSLIRFCEDHDARVVDDYSGRGMYGAKCIAVYCGRHSEVRDYLKRNSMGEGRVDSMGFDVVHYWPSAQVPEGAEQIMEAHKANCADNEDN